METILTSPTLPQSMHQQIISYTDKSFIHFITFPTVPHRPILAQDLIHCHLIQAWQEHEEWSVGSYIVMPDHIHLFCTPANSHNCDLSNWSRKWKKSCSFRLPRLRGIWQADSYGPQIQNEADYFRMQWHMLHNPVRAKLVMTPGDWPYTGRIHDLSGQVG